MKVWCAVSPVTVPFAVLLDVDGPIASPITRTIRLAQIPETLLALDAAGVPIVFNTGRSDAFLRDVVLPPLLTAGLRPDATLYGVCEKGAVWFRMGAAGLDSPMVDAAHALPQSVRDWVAGLVRHEFADIAFFDETKRAMISVEQHPHVENDLFVARQRQFDERVFAHLAGQGFAVEWGDRRVPGTATGNGAGQAAAAPLAVRIDTTIISTDIEGQTTGKDLGAQRAWELLSADGVRPQGWKTLGDSRTDYAMATWLHQLGEQVVHGDVRPGDGIPDVEYRVQTVPGLIHDDAGALLLTQWLAEVAS